MRTSCTTRAHKLIFFFAWHSRASVDYKGLAIFHWSSVFFLYFYFLHMVTWVTLGPNCSFLIQIGQTRETKVMHICYPRIQQLHKATWVYSRTKMSNMKIVTCVSVEVCLRHDVITISMISTILYRIEIDINLITIYLIHLLHQLRWFICMCWSQPTISMIRLLL